MKYDPSYVLHILGVCNALPPLQGVVGLQHNYPKTGLFDWTITRATTDGDGMKPYYQDDAVTIIHGDCREIMPTLEPVDLVLTDPPYGVDGTLNSRTARLRGHKKNAYTMFQDSIEYVLEVAVPAISTLINLGHRVVLTPGNRCVTLYPPPDSFGAIFQPASVGLQPWGRADAQPILYYGKTPYGRQSLPSQRCSYQSAGAAEKSDHPCPKPLKLWKQILASTSLEHWTILDPFMGSGTTLRAAKDLGRKAIGIEIEERYCEIAAKRMSQSVMPLEVS